MGGIRSDYVTERQFIVRKPRPPPPGKALFSPGNEGKTSPSVLSLVARDGLFQRLQDGEDGVVTDWSVRVFESPDPIVSTESERTYGERPCYAEPAYGHHYVLVATRDGGDTLSSLSADRWFDILVVIQDRVRWLYQKRGVSYVAVYADHGAAAGDEHAYPHINMVGLPSVPPAIQREADGCLRIHAERGVCPVCHTVESERGGPREILEAHGFVALAPWAPSRPHQVLVYPESHSASFRKTSQQNLRGLAHVLRALLGGVAAELGDVPYHLVFHLAPEIKRTHMHWYVEICPLTGGRTGLEYGYDVVLCPTSPEESARRLGAACRKEFASMMGID